MFTNNHKKLLVAIISALVLLAACQSQNVQEGVQPDAPEAAAEERGGQRLEEEPAPSVTEEDRDQDYAETRPNVQSRDELTVVMTRHDIELDFRKSYFATEAQIFTGIYEGLFSYHPLTLEPVPAAVERWELSEDKMQWTFTIRQNARYWNGDPVSAEDFRSAWLSLIDPKRDSPYAGMLDVIEGARDYRSGIETDPAKVGITAPNARTLIVRLASPAAFFPAMLCHHSFSPIHPSMVNVEDWAADLPVSNGPFRVSSIDSESIVLTKNDRYWDRGSVALNKITIKLTETADEATHLWNSGEARWIAGDVNLDILTDRSGIQVNIMFATHFYFIRSGEPPWDDYRIRRAMALALPWEEIRGTYYLPAESLIFPITGYPEVKGITEADYAQARRLLAEAGFPGGVGAPELVIRLTPSMDAARIGALMASAWRDVLGLNVRVEVIPFGAYYQSMREDGFNVGSTTWIGDFADPYAFLMMWRRDSNLNDARLDDEDYEALIERSMVQEGSARLATLAEAERLLLERGVVLPIFFNPAVNIVDMGELDGWYANALDIHPFKYLAFRAYRPLPGVAMAW